MYPRMMMVNVNILFVPSYGRSNETRMNLLNMILCVNEACPTFLNANIYKFLLSNCRCCRSICPSRSVTFDSSNLIIYAARVV